MPYRLRVTEEEVRQELATMGFTGLSDATVAAMHKDLLKMIKSDLRKLKQERQDAGHIDSSDIRPAAAPRHTHCARLKHSARSFEAPITTPKTKHTKETSHSSLSASHLSEDKEEITGESGYSDFESSTSSLSVTTSRSLSVVIPQRQGSAGVKTRKAKAVDDEEPTVKKVKEIASGTHKEQGGMSFEEATAPGRKAASKRKTQIGKKGLPQYPSRPDPVKLYHYYKAHWDQFKAPGEDPRLKLRWDVRSKLFYAE